MGFSSADKARLLGMSPNSSSNSSNCCLKWSSHAHNITAFLTAQLVKERFADVTLVSAEGQRIQAHKIVLSASSPYFEGVLDSNPCQHPIVILKDVQFTDLQSIINFIYNGEVNVESSRMEEIRLTAATLQIRGISEVDVTDQVKPVNLDFVEDNPVVTSVHDDDLQLSPDILPKTPKSPSSPPSMLESSVCLWPPTSQTPVKIVSSKSKKLFKKSASDEIITTSSGFNDEVTIITAGSSSDPILSSSSKKHVSPNAPTPFVIKATKKKEAWVDPDALNEKRSQQQKKRFRQVSLHAAVTSMPKPKMDISKSKQYNGGSWMPPQATSEYSGRTQPVVDKKAGVKRKSDESIEGEDKRDKLEMKKFDLSQTMYKSPSNDSSAYDHSPPLSPIVGVPKSNEDEKPPKQRSPLSPGKANIQEPKKPKPSTSKPGSSRTVNMNHDSTMELLKDFDKIPEYKTPSPKKSGRSQGKKINGHVEEEKKCTCPSESGPALDQNEINRKKAMCEVHGTGYVPLPSFQTPPDFWRTQQYSTQELYNGGYIKVGTPFTPKVYNRRRRNSDDTYLDDDTDTENDPDS